MSPDLPVQKTVEDDGLVEVFSDKMDVIKRNWGETPSREFTIWFPWHVRWGDNPPTFEMYGHTFESADQSEWRPRLEEIPLLIPAAIVGIIVWISTWVLVFVIAIAWKSILFTWKLIHNILTSGVE